MRTSARIKVPVMEVDAWMPKHEKGRIDLPDIRRRVDEEVQAREEELEYARERGDPTALWKALSAAAEKGMLGLIEDEEVRRLAGGRGSHKTADGGQVAEDSRRPPGRSERTNGRTAALATAECR